MDTLRLLSTLLIILLLFAFAYDFYLAVKYVESDVSKDITMTENEVSSSHHNNSNNNSNNPNRHHKKNQQSQSSSQ